MPNYEDVNEEIQKKENDSNSVFGVVNKKDFYLDPARNSCGLKVMKGFVKFLRFLYLSVIYYFMPFVFTFLTFISTLEQIESGIN